MIIKEYLKVDKVSLNNPVAIIGLPGIALVGKFAVDAIIDFAKPKKIADIIPFDFPPRVIVNEEGVPKSLKATVYLWKREGDRDVILITADAQPYSIEGQYRFSKQILDFLNSLGISLVIACAASVTTKIEGDPKVQITTASKELLADFQKHPLVRIFKNGIISGGNGLIPTLASEIYNMQSICMLAETVQISEQIDPKASKSILIVLNDKLNLGVDLTGINLKIKEIEKITKALESVTTTGIMKKEKDETQAYIS